jgi:small-conductance mechanosensitive channel
MSVLQKIFATVLLVLLVVTGYGLWATQSISRGGGRHGRGTTPAVEALSSVDQTDLATAQKLEQEATFRQEKEIAQEAVVAADHELDLAFAAALRRIEAHPPVLSPEAQKIEARLNASQKLLEADQASVAQLTAALNQAGPAQRSSLQDQLNVAQSQLELDQDEVQEANQELVAAGGNVHQRIQAMMQQHTATEQKPALVAATADPLANLRGLARRIRLLSSIRDRRREVEEAREHIASSISGLMDERKAMIAQLDASKSSVPELAKHTRSARAGDTSDAGAAIPAPAAASPAPAATTGAPAPSLLTTTRQITADQRVLTLLDQRIETRKDLLEQYGKWNILLGARMGRVLHAALINAAVVIGILLALLFLDRWLEKLFGRTRLDRRQIATLRTVTRVALQIVGIVSIVLVLVGMPGQIGTFLGIVGAGLTVALKDFIVAFIGWLVLMGKNGMRIGDWVEIEGVSGEVIELGMFRTVLLETGNWSNTGRPTGRRVTFTNSFAFQKHYFNFSTSGQWLWDEVLVLVPYERDPHAIADAIHKEVMAATEQTAREAEIEWRRALRSQRETTFSAEPGIIIRPATGGVEVAVRYLTRASDRFKLRTRLYQTAVQMLSGRPTPERLPATTQS